MGFRVSRSGKKAIARIKNLDRMVPTQLEKSLYFVGKLFKETANKNILKRPRKGRVYKFKGRRHIASVKGESWANRSGDARRGIGFKVASPFKMRYFNVVPYVRFLENRNLNRPAMFISIVQNRKNVINVINKHIREVT